MIKKFFEGSDISTKNFFIILFLIVNALTWLFTSPTIIEGTLEGLNIANEQEIMVWLAYYSSIIISCILGSILASKINRFKFINAWIAIGIVTSIVPILYSSFTWMDCLIISILLGITFGSGLPSILSYFADMTRVENRGRISGIILLVAYMVTPLLTTLVKIFDLQTNLFVFAGWKSLSLIAVLLQPNQEISHSASKPEFSLSDIIKDKTFNFYFFAWIMFVLVDSIAGPVVVRSLGELSNLFIITPILVSITALIGGIVTDWIGRKKTVLYGFISLGIAYALIGVAPQEQIVGYFFIFINGITIGLLFLSFLFVLWGDISQSGPREKYYALGIIPFFLSFFIGLFVDDILTTIEDYKIFPIAAIFLFLAVFPVLYAPETLPEKKVELRRLRSFAEEAKKTREKYEQKMKKRI